MTIDIRRRRLIMAALGALLAGGAGTVAYMRQTDFAGAWIRAMLARHLPDVEIDAPSLDRFISHALSGPLLPASRRWLLLLDGRLPVLTRSVPVVRSALENAERRLLSEFLIGSNFFAVAHPRRQPIQFFGVASACPNPFAVFVDGAASSASGSATPARGATQ